MLTVKTASGHSFKPYEVLIIVYNKITNTFIEFNELTYYVIVEPLLSFLLLYKINTYFMMHLKASPSGVGTTCGHG